MHSSTFTLQKIYIDIVVRSVALEVNILRYGKHL